MGSGIITACNPLGLNSDLAAPDVHETNAAAGRYVQDVQYGLCTLLFRYGLPAA